MEIVHTSVMAEEALQYLQPRKEDSLFLDGTLGEGGHSEAGTISSSAIIPLMNGRIVFCWI